MRIPVLTMARFLTLRPAFEGLQRLGAVLATAIGLVACSSTYHPEEITGLSTIHGQMWMHWVDAERMRDGLAYKTGSANTQTVSIGRPPAGEVIATGAAGAVEVGVIDNSLEHAEPARDLAALVAGALSSVHTSIWPHRPVPVQAEIYVIEALSSQGFSVSHQWKPGQAWTLAFGIERSELRTEPGRIRYAEMLAHELYHLFIEATGGGGDRSGSNYAAILEEVAASLYGRCAVILEGYETSMETEPRLTLNLRSPGGGARVAVPFSDVWLDRILVRMRQANAAGDEIPYGLHIALRITVFSEISQGSVSIQPETEEAQRLLSVCRRFAARPVTIEDWLAAIASDGRDAELHLPDANPANASATAS